MLRKELNIPPRVAKAFVRDMKAFFRAKDQLKQDEIAASTGWMLKQHLRRGTKLRLVLFVVVALTAESIVRYAGL
jgi:hypothetical protein